MLPNNIELTKLVGFDPTELEIIVAHHTSFQFLRSRGWPFKWGELITGKLLNQHSASLRRDYSSLDLAIAESWEPTGVDPLTPHAATVRFDETVHHARSLYTLAARVARDATEAPKDKELIRDLQL